ncbi:MarR family transcriptional regulator, partial [Streptomyces sp. TRM76130]|nr:MarR family transcriptional regulator [Streptomyces sp. TRM76130]
MEGTADVREVLSHLTRLGNAINRGRLTERAMESAGLSLDRPAMTVLLSVHLADRPLRIGEIAERMQVVGP